MMMVVQDLFLCDWLGVYLPFDSHPNLAYLHTLHKHQLLRLHMLTHLQALRRYL
jgi:hypothetical protein